MNRIKEAMKIAAVLLTGLLLVLAGGGAQGDSDGLGLVQKTGGMIPLNATFHDEDGGEVKFGQLLGRPAVLVLTYYRCTHICPEMLAGISDVIGKLSLAAGKDYSVITLSFDEGDSPAAAKALKSNYVKPLGALFPSGSWKFLTGDRESIWQILDAVGMGVRKVQHGFDHPVVLIFLSPDGRITRYMNVSKFHYGVAYPITFSPIRFAGAISDAAEGQVMPSDGAEPLNCFVYEPTNEPRFFGMLKVLGIATLLLMVMLLFYLGGTRKILGKGENDLGR